MDSLQVNKIYELYNIDISRTFVHKKMDLLTKNKTCDLNAYASWYAILETHEPMKTWIQEDDVWDPWTHENDPSLAKEVSPTTGRKDLGFSMRTEACWDTLPCLNLSGLSNIFFYN